MAEPRFAPVANLAGYNMLAESKILGDYHLVIAPQVLKASWGYADFFQKRHPGCTVILDNGVIEVDYPLTPKELAVAANVVQASVVVVPDTVDDAKQTAKQARSNIPILRNAIPDHVKLMGVVQGEDYEECRWCADQLVEAGVDWLAVPRGLTKNLQSRVPLIESLAKQHGLPLHALGFSNNLYDDMQTAVAHPLVQGIDAATPMWVDRRLPLSPPTDEARALGLGRRPKDYWTSQPAEQAGHNVETIRRWLRDEWTTAQAARSSEDAPALRMDPQTPR